MSNFKTLVFGDVKENMTPFYCDEGIKNPNIKCRHYALSKDGNLLILKNGKHTSQSKKGDLDLEAMRAKLHGEAIKNLGVFRTLLKNSRTLDDFAKSDLDSDKEWKTPSGQRIYDLVRNYKAFDENTRQDILLNVGKWRAGIVLGDDTFGYDAARSLVPFFAMVHEKKWMDKDSYTVNQINSMMNFLIDTARDDTLITVLDARN